VTNKHVICRDPLERLNVSHVVCHFNTRNADGVAGTASGHIPLANPDGSKRFRQHPDSDVLAIEVTDVVNLNPQLEKRWATYDLFADECKRKELDITVGEEIVTVGYPLGLKQGETNLPLLRQGISGRFFTHALAVLFCEL